LVFTQQTRVGTGSASQSHQVWLLERNSGFTGTKKKKYLVKSNKKMEDYKTSEKEKTLGICLSPEDIEIRERLDKVEKQLAEVLLHLKAFL
jgi:predicted aldo/keto reductase-like oxidoreductase